MGATIEATSGVRTGGSESKTPESGASSGAGSTFQNSSATQALDAPQAGSEFDAIKVDEEAPQKIDMTGDIGANRSVDGKEQAIASQKKQGGESVKAAGENKTGDGLQTAGSVVAGVGGVLALCLGPFAWVGAIVAAVGGILGAVGSGMKSSAQKTAETEKGIQEEKSASLESNMGQDKENIINEQLSAKTEIGSADNRGPVKSDSQVSQGATATLNRSKNVGLVK